MAIHDWTRVQAGLIHEFDLLFLVRLHDQLNATLPSNYYALVEQHTRPWPPDVLTLQWQDRSAGAGESTVPAKSTGDGDAYDQAFETVPRRVRELVVSNT